MKTSIIIIVLMANVAVAFAQKDTLDVYGPGGPLSAMQDCAKAFTVKTGIPVKVTGGPEPKWLSQAQADGDVIDFTACLFGLNSKEAALKLAEDESALAG